MTIRPYIALTRLDRPIGIWLLFFPAAWAVAFTSPTPAPLMVLMLVGASITRCAGCIINDLTDRTLDAQVERTRNRPLASGAISARAALILLAVLLAMALGIAWLLPVRVFYLAWLALPMIAAYPWMKRITWWPQLFLGLTFNLGALFGWLAAGAALEPAAFTLYAAGIFWTLGYDTIYAVQDIDDDAKAGIRSSARAIGPYLKPFVTACYMLTLILLGVTGWLMHAGLAYCAALLVAAAQALWQIRQLPCPADKAGMLFRSNQWFGLIVLLGLLFGRFV